jgi:hypothetical protein
MACRAAVVTSRRDGDTPAQRDEMQAEAARAVDEAPAQAEAVGVSKLDSECDM